MSDDGTHPDESVPGDDTDLAEAVEAFLDGADDALSEYDQGYADADATLRVLRSHLADLRDAAEE